MRTPAPFACFPLLSTLAVIALLTGCSSSFDPTENPVAPVTTPMSTITGSVYGGRQPIVGSKVFLLASNTTGSGGKSLSLIKSTQAGALLDSTSGSATNGDYYVLTDANGGFSLSGNTCTSGQQVYLYSQGGVATTGGADNPQIGLMAVLGDCPAGNSFDNAGFVYMNELTTVAASYAIAGFATNSTRVSSTGSPQALVGIRNAFANAAQLNNVFSPAQSALARTPTTNSVVPQNLINSLANVLISCVNSANTSASTTTPCNILRAFATSDGVQHTVAASGSANSGFASDAPADTASAMINLVHYPYSANVTTIFNLAQSSGAGIFTPALSSAPTDFTVQLLFHGAVAGNALPHTLAADASGNVYNCGVSPGTLSKFTPLGVQTSITYSYGNMTTVAGCAMDTNSTQLYIIGNQSNLAATLVLASITGGSTTTKSPQWQAGATLADIAIDSSGNLWITDYASNGNNGAVYVLSSAGILQSTLPGTGSNGVNSPFAVAIQAGATGKTWLANYTDVGVLNQNNTLYADYSITLNLPLSDAIDASGNVWVSGGEGRVSRVTAANGQAAYFTATTDSTSGASTLNLPGLAIDGNNNVWVSGSYGTASSSVPVLQELSSNGARLGPDTSFSTTGSATGLGPVVIDPSGNVWYSTTSDSNLREILGAAGPVLTPLSLAVLSNRLGQRP